MKNKSMGLHGYVLPSGLVYRVVTSVVTSRSGTDAADARIFNIANVK